MKIGMSSLHGSLDKNIVWGICNFKMVAIFQAGWCLVEHLSDGLFGNTSMKIGTISLYGSLDYKPPTAT